MRQLLSKTDTGTSIVEQQQFAGCGPEKSTYCCEKTKRTHSKLANHVVRAPSSIDRRRLRRQLGVSAVVRVQSCQ